MKTAPKFQIGDIVENNLNNTVGQIFGVIEAMYLIQIGSYNNTMALPIYFKADPEWDEKYIYYLRTPDPEPVSTQDHLYQRMIVDANTTIPSLISKYHHVPEFALKLRQESQLGMGALTADVQANLDN